MGPKMKPKTLFFAMKNPDFRLHFGPQNGPLWRPFFSRFLSFSKPSSDRKMQTVLYRRLVLLPGAGPQKTVFFKVFWTSILAPCWFRFGPILAPSWPLSAPLGPSWPLLASSWLHFGSILASLGPSLRPLGPVLALLLAPLCGRRSSGPFWVPAVHETPYMHDAS